MQEVATGQRRRVLRGLPGIPHSLAVNPEGNENRRGIGDFRGDFGSAEAEGQVVVWDATTGQSLLVPRRARASRHGRGFSGATARPSRWGTGDCTAWTLRSKA